MKASNQKNMARNKLNIISLFIILHVNLTMSASLWGSQLKRYLDPPPKREEIHSRMLHVNPTLSGSLWGSQLKTYMVPPPKREEIHSSISRHDVSRDWMLDTLDAMEYMMTSRLHFDRDYYFKLTDCMNAASPRLWNSQVLAWKGFHDYWLSHGTVKDPWGSVDHPYMEQNASKTILNGLVIYEPCNYASNVAMYHVVTEICDRAAHGAPFAVPDRYLIALIKGFSQLAFGSSFMHGTHTHLGGVMDVSAMKVVTYLIHQVSLAPLIEYNYVRGRLKYSQLAILVHLARVPRRLNAIEMADAYEEMFLTRPVYDWNKLTDELDLPDYHLVISAILTTIFSFSMNERVTYTLITNLASTFSIPQDIRDFIEHSYLPQIQYLIRPLQFEFSTTMEILGNAVTLLTKFLYAFLWQEDVMTNSEVFQGARSNRFGAYMLPSINSGANSFSSLKYQNEYLQRGVNLYPGEGWCQDYSPHAKWHVQSAIGTLDMFYVMDHIYGLTMKQLTPWMLN